MMLKCFVLCFCCLPSIAPTFRMPSCPEICYCMFEFTDCKYNGLTNLPSNIDYNVTSLDLSHNNFDEFPTKLSMHTNLKYLNLSHNKISVLGYSALAGLTNLEQLDFTFNVFVDWMDIRGQVFTATRKLMYLDLSHNPLRSIPVHLNPLRIKSLAILKLVNCSMRSLPENLFDKLPNIKELHVAQNPITYLNISFSSSTLKFLDLSRCNLSNISNSVLYNLTALETIWLYKNRDLKKFACVSNSLLYMDISNCNLEKVPTGRLDRLYFANFHGNHFRTITQYNFANFLKLKYLDLSNNAISLIEENAFNGLDDIEFIDLSFNTLLSLTRNLFHSNILLRSLNLSHNYFSKIEQLSSKSLEILDFSSCEIQFINSNSLVSTPNLSKLYLSRNLISTIPNELMASNLEVLDVSLCHIKNINNKTFASMSSLRDLDISGNRLTVVQPSCFFQVIYLDISDNPWRCDCSSLKETFLWMMRTGKATDKLLCESPERFEGATWMVACQTEWRAELERRDQAWWYSMGLIATMLVVLVVIVAMRKMCQLKEKRVQEATAVARRAEEREALRRMHRMQVVVHEEASRNAPDPRELQTPPSYNEALLLPRLDASHPSLAGSQHSVASSKQGSNTDIAKKVKTRRKRRRRKSDSLEGQRASRRADDDSDTTSDNITQPRVTLESDF